MAGRIPQSTKELLRAPPISWFAGVIAVVALGWAVHSMAAVLIPVTFAVFIALILTPLVDQVSAAVPARLSWLGVVAAMIVLLALTLFFVAGVSFAFQQLGSEVPRIADQVQSIMPENAQQTMADTEGTAIWPQIQSLLQGAGGAFGSRIIDFAGGFARQAATIVSALIASLVIIFFLVLLMLSEKDAWAAKIKAMSNDRGETEWFANLDMVIHRLRKFLFVRAVIGAVTATLYAGWLALFGIDLLVVWAILTFLLTFVPNLGSLISGILPTLYAFLILDPAIAFIVGSGLFVIEQVLGNFIDPKLQGREIVLSPLVILVSLLIWGWMWGPIGTLLATPITILLVCALQQSEKTKTFALMLSNQRDMSQLDDALNA